MGGTNVQEPAARAPRDNERKAGNSGEGSDSVLRLLRMRWIAQVNETAADPDAARETPFRPRPAEEKT